MISLHRSTTASVRCSEAASGSCTPARSSPCPPRGRRRPAPSGRAAARAPPAPRTPPSRPAGASSRVPAGVRVAVRTRSNPRLNQEEPVVWSRPRAALSSVAQSAGVSVSATIPESTTAITIVIANSLVQRPGDAADERHRHEHRAEHEHDGDQRAADLAHRLVRRLARAAGAPRHDALDVLDHDDRVVHHDADREHQPEQRQRVDREAERPAARETCR